MVYYVIAIGIGLGLVGRLIVPEWVKSTASTVQTKSWWAWLDPGANFKAFILRVIQKTKPAPTDVRVIQEFLDQNEQREIVTDFKSSLTLQDLPILQQKILELETRIQQQNAHIQELKNQTEHLENLLIEKNKSLTRINSELTSEKMHRQEFEKIRSLMDEQIVKERQQNHLFKNQILQLNRKEDHVLNRLARYEEPTD